MRSGIAARTLSGGVQFATTASIFKPSRADMTSAMDSPERNLLLAFSASVTPTQTGLPEADAAVAVALASMALDIVSQMKTSTYGAWNSTRRWYSSRI